MTLSETTESRASLPLSIPVDAEHSGIRAVGCLVLFSTFILIVWLTSQVLTDGLLPGIFAGLIVASILTIIVDRALKGRWASGREISIANDRIALVNKGQAEFEINPQQTVSPLLWYFIVKRNGRVKKGWYVISFALEQEDVFIPVYTFSAPADFEKLPFHKQFTKLEKKDVDSDNMRIAGTQKRLLIAENRRGYHGAEMTPTQFTHYLTTLKDHFPSWMPKE